MAKKFIAVAGALALLTAFVPGTASAAPTPTPPGTFTEQNVVADRTANNWFYRIPAMAYLGNNTVITAFDARPGSSNDSPNPNSIMGRISTDNGTSWGPMFTIAAGFPGDATTGKYGYSDPSFVLDTTTGELFCFFVHSKDTGLGASSYGNDDANRQVISSAVTSSKDGGKSWSTPRLITSVTKPGADPYNPKPGAMKGNFASSGEGIQLRYGAHPGRLVQQYAGFVLQPNGSEAFQAYSVYSDDHGATWKRGAFVGAGMDENKVVELSDGRLMMNSRDSAKGGYRKVAYSNDGGETWGPVTVDTQLDDPANNGSITRLFPDAPQGSPDAAKLLFTNAFAQDERRNVSARVSCDNGTSWTNARTINAGGSSYSTATRIGGGKIAVFYEVTYTNDMRVAVFDDAWLNYVCAPLSAANVTAKQGVPVEVPVTITNQELSAIAGGSVTVQAPAGWSSSTASVGSIAPGNTATTTITLTAPGYATGTVRMPVVFTTNAGTRSQYMINVALPAVDTSTATPAATIVGSRTDTARDLAAEPYRVGDAVPYQFRVTNTSPLTETVTPTEGTFNPFLPPAGGNCRWRNLKAGAAYSCTTPKHVVTAEELAQGFFHASSTWTLSADGKADVTVKVDGGEVDLLARKPALYATRTIAPAQPRTGRYDELGEAFTVTTTLSNTGNVTLTDLAAPGLTLETTTLAPGQQTVATSQVALSEADLAAGALVLPALKATAANGATVATSSAEQLTTPLTVRPAKPTTEPNRPRFLWRIMGPGRELGLNKFYVPGEAVTVHNLRQGQWYFLYLNRTGEGLGWHFVEEGDSVTATLPTSIKPGLEGITALASDGRVAAADRTHIRRH